ncbi:hypothetical protein [Dinghuibacter silviterrae]|uniref:Uncharacterized protein n=1 Tax=Dinghuibacter silviterrae TaxID=1539049 RepID=A0A4R8DHI0_9BACT|nr:hypothetical protein [Dinghuibacter silviterrae]TDW96977.1 hypothetical protein EDB95_4813 [Dinghuibacter silviterrae]
MQKLSKSEMKQVRGGIGTCMAILICDCSGTDKEEIVDCVYAGGGWTAGCTSNCSWVRTVVDYCDLC